MIRFWVIFLFFSCAEIPFLKRETPFSGELKTFKAFENKDYLDHLASLGQIYLSSQNISAVKLPKKQYKYLNGIFQKVVSNNEQILSHYKKPSFYIIKSQRPFYFSLPNSQFFFSLGLLKKYMKNEQLLNAVIALEILKSLKGVYEKRIIIPKGFLSTEQMLGIIKTPSEVKFNLNKWSFYILKRSGMDPFALLNWIQIQNKNALDFDPYSGGMRDQTREEYLFKNFLVKEGLKNGPLDEDRIRPSKEFYQFLSFIRSQ